MVARTIREVRDYNRTLAVPIRWLHLGAALIALSPIGAIWRWSWARPRRAWAGPAVVGLILTLVLLPFDAPLVRWAQSMARAVGSRASDVTRELEAVQQFGAATSLVVVTLIVILQDTARWRRAFDLWVAMAMAAPLVSLTKILVGRPRPSLGDPEVFLGPFGAYPILEQGGRDVRGVYHAWELWEPIGSKLWSMPSSHTAYAVILSMFIAALYPRLRWLAYPLACLVGFARLWFGAHYPSDIVAGATIGLVVSRIVYPRRLGVQVLRYIWIRVLGRQPGQPEREALDLPDDPTPASRVGAPRPDDTGTSSVSAPLGTPAAP